MPMVCTICRDPAKRAAVDRFLLKGEGPRPIARRLAHLNVSKDAVHRHALHCSALLARSPEKAEVADDVLRGKFIRATESLIGDLERLRRKAEAARDTRGAARIIETSFRGLELLAKFVGVLSDRPQHASLHLHLPPERARAVAAAYLARHAPQLEVGQNVASDADNSSTAKDLEVSGT